ADPEVREWNRAQLSYNKEGITATVGRQRIILDNARFVGNVGWRANEQTYDGASLKLVNGPVEFFFAYIDQVNSILPALDMDTNSKLFNLGYSTPIGKISGYGYLLDDQDRDIQTDTVGARFSGKAAMDTVSFTYTAEYAAQEKEANAGNNDAEYMALELGVEAKGATFAIGNETLGSDDGAYGFQTPLATKHAFNGWADMFLATPADGLSDTYIKVGGNAKGVKLLAVYHDFKADEGSNDYGTELDLLAVKKFGNYTVGAKYASYKAEDVKVDDDKVWLWVQTKF
ncbi:MAG: hypothetical protein P1U57_03430, partial [Oleibacter sp.]|nr:hypothetical protein [Thalassolituus sp.]